MIREPEDRQDLNLLDTWRDIIQSDNWKLFKDLLAEHQAYLESQVLVSVKTKDIDRAMDCSSRADECKKILSLVDSRLAELKKESK